MSDLDDIDLTPVCVYAYKNQKEPCWGQVEDHGTEARIYTCVGHSRVPQGYSYYTREVAERALVTGGKMTLALHESRLGAGYDEALDGIWDKPLPERPYDKGFEANFPKFVHNPPPPRVPPPVRDDVVPQSGELLSTIVLPEKVRLVVDGNSDEDIPEVWKDYL